MKKLRNLILFFLGLFLLYVIFSALPKNYEYTYRLGDIKVRESYNKKEKLYTYLFSASDNKYEYSIKNNYINKRGLIKTANIENGCLTASSNALIDFSVCKNDNEYYTKFANDIVEGKISYEVENIDVYDLHQKTFYIWNYTEFISLLNKDVEKISLFENDVYELELITKLNDYLVVADYNQKYKFNKLYLINSKNNKVEEVNLDKNIYFNSYILGTYKKHIYIYDLQKELEYKINPFKSQVSKNAYEILVNDEWEKVSVNKLNKKNLSFKNSSLFGYYVKENVLYYKNNNIVIRVSNLPVSNIIESNDQEAYFISEDTLYRVDINKGITKVMRYSEWNFTSKNIYIF